MTLAALARSKRVAPASKGGARGGSRHATCAVGTPFGLIGSAPRMGVATSAHAPLIQTELKIGEPNDKFEQEADRVADQVMRMADPRRAVTLALAGDPPDGVQRLCAECEEEVRRQPIEEEEEKLQMQRVAGATAEIGPGVQAQISSLRYGGQPLAPSLRSFFEPRFGHDFSQVHIHQGSQASEAARAIGARAYTLGRDMVFGQGEYRPGSDRGRRLIAHELTHVVQQTGVDRAFVQRQGSAELSTTEGQLLPAPPPASIGHGPENRIAGLCPVLAEGTLSEVSWGESASMYPTKDMAPTKEALYYPENWDQAKNCELLKARGAMDLISQRNPDVQRGTPSPKDVIHQRVKKYHFIENWLSTSLRLVDSARRNGESGRRRNRGGRVRWPTSC